MGLVILVAMGAMFGWLAAFVMGRESPDTIMRNAGAGIIGAVLAGALANSVSVLRGISAPALLLAIVGAIAVIAFANLVRVKA